MTQEKLRNTREDMVDSFLRTALHDLDHFDDDRIISLSDLRQHILKIQQEALRTTARQHQVSEETLQTAIQNSSSSSEKLNLAARRAFCRIVLSMDLDRFVVNQNARNPTDNDMLQFLGLVITAHDEGFIGRIHSKDMAQEIFWKALGYDPVLANQSLQDRIREYNNNPGAELVLVTYQTMVRKLQDDGVTRVVAVQYSEFNPDGTTTDMLDDPIPRSGTMERTTSAPPNNHIQQNTVPWQIETLRHQLMQEIQSMQGSERDRIIQQARETAKSVLAKVTQPDLTLEQRTLFLSSLDEETQRLMIINKLWQEDSASIERN
jgi:hypothetical protein